MGVGEGLLMALVIIIAFGAMIRGRKGVRRDRDYQHPHVDEDTARIRQMKEWDRFDDSKSGRS